MSSFSTFLRVERNHNDNTATNTSWLFLRTDNQSHISFYIPENCIYLKLHILIVFLINDMNKWWVKKATWNGKFKRHSQLLWWHLYLSHFPKMMSFPPLFFLNTDGGQQLERKQRALWSQWGDQEGDSAFKDAASYALCLARGYCLAGCFSVGPACCLPLQPFLKCGPHVGKTGKQTLICTLYACTCPPGFKSGNILVNYNRENSFYEWYISHIC